MKRLAIITVISAALASSPASAQENAAALLSYDCGSSDEIAAFRNAAIALGPDAERVFLAALAEGAPAAMRAAEEKRLSAQYDLLQRTLGEQGGSLARVIEEGGPALPAREAFIADGLRRLDARARENALRGLGAVGGGVSTDAIKRAAAADPDLQFLASMALQEIAARK
jgi:hypothetical protein